jgi:hypothetical protein
MINRLGFSGRAGLRVMGSLMVTSFTSGMILAFVNAQIAMAKEEEGAGGSAPAASSSPAASGAPSPSSAPSVPAAVPSAFAAVTLRPWDPPDGGTMLHPWRLVAGKHWQIGSPDAEDIDATDRMEGTRGACPMGMVEVQGAMKTDPVFARPEGYNIEEMQKAACTKWISREYPERCGEFDRDKWLSIVKDLPTRPMHFCIDRFEYPNQRGQYPMILVSWHEASRICTTQGKRLCTETEWTFACEGEEATPYPNGYVRDPDACVNDQPWRAFNEHAYSPRDGQNAVAELDRLWQGLPSGARPKCKSSFGVYDMTGNVDEWTRSVRDGERQSILKGGYWGPVRTRCRPSTRSHDESFTFYQQGVRCCADTPKH